jgi:hypothetical protein
MNAIMRVNEHDITKGMDAIHTHHTSLLSKSRRFQPDRVQKQTRLGTLWTGVKERRKRVVRETTEGHASFVSRPISIGLLLVIINLAS